MDKIRLHSVSRAVGVVLLMAAVSSRAAVVTVAWNPPTAAMDGTPLGNISSYRLYYGESAGAYDQYVEVSDATSATVSGLEYNKRYFFAVKTYTANSQSDYSEELNWTSLVMPDVDTDNISDEWELQHANSLSTMQASSDFDSDGVSDYNEFIAGTNPSDPQDFPAIEIHANPSGASVSFQTRQATGNGYENRQRYYTLMQCDDLTSGNWTPVHGYENILASGQTENPAIETDSQAVFYRVETQLH